MKEHKTKNWEEGTFPTLLKNDKPQHNAYLLLNPLIAILLRQIKMWVAKVVNVNRYTTEELGLDKKIGHFSKIDISIRWNHATKLGYEILPIYN